MSHLRTRSGGAKVFLVSGVTDEIRKDLAKKINQLGGKYFDLQYFKAICTHVICGKLSKSEKFLGGCARGKWVLHPDFIYQSVAAGTWLDEEQFEWCDERILRRCSGVEPELYFASRRWRFLLGDDNHGAFQGWKVAVVAGAKKSQVIKRLLISGGAEVLNLKLPVRNPGKVANTLGYIFVSQQNVDMVGHLFEYGVLCIKPEFIADYLLKDPQPDPMDYLAQYNPNTDGDQASGLAGSQDSFLMESQASLLPLLVSSSPGTPTTPELGSVIDLVNVKTDVNRRRSGRGLANRSKVKHEAQSDDVIEIDITPQDRGASRTTATQSRADLDGLVIDLVSCEDSYSGHASSRSKAASQSSAAVEVISADVINRKSTRSCTAKSSPAWKQLIPRSRAKNAEHISDDRDVKSVDESRTAAIDSKCDLEGGVTDLLNSKESTRRTMSEAAERIETDVGKNRACTTNSSPAWKSLIPRSKVKSSELISDDKEVKALGRRRSAINEVKENAANTGNNGVRRSCSAGCSISTTQKEDSTVAMETEKENLKSSQDRVTSTPAKRVMSGKLSRSAALANMSPITAYFKRLIRIPETDGQNSRTPDSDCPMVSRANSAKKTLIGNCQASTSPLVDGHSRSARPDSIDGSQPLDTPKITHSSDTPSEDTVNTQSHDKDMVKQGVRFLEEKAEIPIEGGTGDSKTMKERRKDGTDSSLEVPKQLPTWSLKGRRTTSATAGVEPVAQSSGTTSGDSGVITGVERMDIDPITVQPVVGGDDASTPHTHEDPAVAGISRKRKSSEDPSLHQYIREQKRQKTSISEWRPTKFSISFQDEKNEADRLCMRRATTDIIHTTFEEEEFTLIALQELNSRVSRLYFPPAETLAMLIHKILPKAETEIEGNLAHQILMKILRLHPPVTMEMQQVYLQALAGAGEERGVAEEWHMMRTCIRMILQEDDTILRRNYVLLFQFLQEVLHQNLQHFMLNAHVKTGIRHMLLRILWSPSYHVVFNNRCRELLDLMVETLNLYQTQNSEQNKGLWLSLLQSLVWMVAMAAECCRLEEMKVVRGVRALQLERVSAFVHEVTRRLIEANLQDQDLLQCILMALQLPWLCVGVCQQLLNVLDDYLLADDMLKDTKAITLSVIVSRYFFLLPRMSSKLELKEKTPTALKLRHGQVQRGSDAPTKCLFENTEVNLNGLDKQNSQINKKNAKGETQLHKACIVGNVTKVKRLLQVPGIDVNARDNFGWTPLHEACNHGHVECVRELLKIVPSKSVIQYFNKGHKLSKVDLLACNDEGITPLHDAVLNGRLEVSRLLLQHSGARLLSAVTSANYTPLHLATTEEMHAMLSSFVPLKRRISEESVVGSQDSISSADEVRMEMPSDVLYNEVLNVDGSPIFVETKALISYIHLTTSLLYSYIMAVGLENVKTRSARHRKSHTEQNSFHEQEGAQGRQPQQGSLNSSHLPCDKVSSCDSNSHGLLNATEKENIPSACGVKSVDYHRTTAITKSLCSKEVPKSPLRPPESLDHLEGEDRILLKKDMKVLRHMTKYLNMFHDHLFKLCRQEDRSIVDSELLQLNCLVEHLLNQ